MHYSISLENPERLTFQIRKPSFCWFVLLWLVPTLTMADTVSLSLPGSKVATATWHNGNVERPAIIVMHGFLQTRTFRATSNIIEALSSQGHAILAPNLSLGISNRQQSMQCQAAHQHTFDGDLKEIFAWTQWLKAKGFKSFVVVGHSWGSQHGISFTIRYPQVSVKALIAISLTPPHITQSDRTIQVNFAQKLLLSQPSALHTYQLSFCKNYTSTPVGYLSYAACTEEKLLKGLAKLRNRKIPVYVILGSKDRRINVRWINLMKKNSDLILVKGANHFFSSVYEIELAEKLEDVLGRMAKIR